MKKYGKMSTIDKIHNLFRTKKVTALKLFKCVELNKFIMCMVHKYGTRSTQQIMEIQPIINVFRQAQITFNDKVSNSEQFSQNLVRLKDLMDRLTADDLGLDHSYLDPNMWKQPRKAPCTYVQVFENKMVNLSVFILRPGFTMPLHDHPQMHGLLKVISGVVKIRSYTEFKLNEDSGNIRSEMYNGYFRRFFSKASPILTLGPESETCILTPTSSNYHEIQALDNPVAFFDILAPPYDTPINGRPRKCRYYEKIREMPSNLVELCEIAPPNWFYCDEAPYLGPILNQS